MKEFKRILKYIKNYKLWAFLAPILIVFEVAMELFIPKIMSDIINIGIAGNDIVYISLNIVLMLSLAVLGIVGGLGSVYFATKVSESVSSDLRRDLFSKVNTLSFFDFNKVKTGTIMTILTNDINIIGNVIQMMMRFLFRVPIILIGSVLMALLISPKLSLILLFIIPFIIVVIFIAIKKGLPYFYKSQEMVDKVNEGVRDNIGGIRVVKAFAMENYEIEKFEKINIEMKETLIKAYTLMTVLMPLMMFFIRIATILVLWYGNELVIDGSLDIGSILAFIQYLTHILMSLVMASMAFAFLIRSFASAKRIAEIHDYNSNLTYGNSNKAFKGNIEFKNVSFSYKDGEGDHVLKDINFKIYSGEKVAILGSTGSGKTTIAYLISRFYDVTDGLIEIDGKNIKDYSSKTLRKNIGFVFQQATLFSGTIKSNIKYGVHKSTDLEVIKAAKIAGAHEFIMKKDKKYDDVVEQLGRNLSGGQKQRLSLARTILLNPSVMILDDTTSALDATTEKKVRTSLYKNLKDKTIITITQRISTASEADKIIVLEDGEVSGIGNHDELLKNNQIYKSIYESQVKGGDERAR